LDERLDILPKIDKIIKRRAKKKKILGSKKYICRAGYESNFGYNKNYNMISLLDIFRDIRRDL